MPRYVAFLRAINLGATRKFPRQSILEAAGSAGFSDLATHLNTGNLHVATSLRSRARVEQALEAAFAADRGFEVPTVALTPAELASVLTDADEIGSGHDGRQFVSFLKVEPADPRRRALEAAAGDGERVVVRGRAVHLLVGPTYRDATVTNATVERHLGVATNRTLGVVRAIVAKWG